MLNLAGEKINKIRNLISSLYARPFNEALMLEVAQSTCQLIDAHYFALFLFAPDKISKPLFISNNPAEFIPVYLSVIQEDFLIDSLVSSGRECVLRRMPDYNDKNHQNFIHAVQKIRPISDIIYIPIKTKQVLSGYWACGRAGAKSPYYTDNQLEIFRFVVSFLNDAFERSLIPPPLEEDVAYLDSQGNILDAGERIKEAFDLLFGRRFIIETKTRRNDLGMLFRKRYKNFLRGPFRLGMDRLTLSASNKRYFLLFKLLKPQGLPFQPEGSATALVRLVDVVDEPGPIHKLDLTAAAKKYHFTPRECEVILGIYLGKSNKEIAYHLGIDESTVKRHTHNIYGKTGVHSRVEFVLGLPTMT